MKQRLSKLQKDILTTLYNSNGGSGKKTKYKMRRDALLFEINDWQEYNRYTKECGFAKLRAGYWKKVPDNYMKKQVSFTRSLQTLAGNNLVYLLHKFNELVSVYGKSFSSKMRVKVKTIDDYRKEGMEKNKWWYEKAKKEDSTIGTFDDWFTKLYQPGFNGMAIGAPTTRLKGFIDEYAGLGYRNTKDIELTETGINKASELLKVK